MSTTTLHIATTTTNPSNPPSIVSPTDEIRAVHNSSASKSEIGDACGLDADAWNWFYFPDNYVLQPHTCYVFTLECVSGCANDNRILINNVSQSREDSGSDARWSLGDHSTFYNTTNDRWHVSESAAANRPLRIQVLGYVANGIRIRDDGISVTSVPAGGTAGDTYRRGDAIDIAVTFNDQVRVPPSIHRGSSSIWTMKRSEPRTTTRVPAPTHWSSDTM